MILVACRLLPLLTILLISCQQHAVGSDGDGGDESCQRSGAGDDSCSSQIDAAKTSEEATDAPDIKEITLNASENWGFALQYQGTEPDIIANVSKGSEAYKAGILIGMRITKIDGVEKRGADIRTALRNAQKANRGVRIAFDRRNVTVSTKKDTDLYHKCLQFVEKLEKDESTLFDTPSRKDDPKLLERWQQKILGQSEQLIQRTGSAKKAEFKDFEGFQNTIKEALHGPYDNTNEDYSFGAGDICQHMFACARTACPMSPKQKLNEIQNLILMETATA